MDNETKPRQDNERGEQKNNPKHYRKNNKRRNPHHNNRQGNQPNQNPKSGAFTISRGMVSTMSDLRGVDTWVNFTETEDKVLCEIRSAKYNINPIAVKYGGGGHAKASGASLKNKEEAMALLADLNALSQGE